MKRAFDINASRKSFIAFSSEARKDLSDFEMEVMTVYFIYGYIIYMPELHFMYKYVDYLTFFKQFIIFKYIRIIINYYILLQKYYMKNLSCQIKIYLILNYFD